MRNNWLDFGGNIKNNSNNIKNILRETLQVLTVIFHEMQHSPFPRQSAAAARVMHYLGDVWFGGDEVNEA